MQVGYRAGAGDFNVVWCRDYLIREVGDPLFCFLGRLALQPKLPNACPQRRDVTRCEDRIADGVWEQIIAVNRTAGDYGSGDLAVKSVR